METGIEQAKSILRSGRPLVFPTDTVWGIGLAVSFCDGPQALAKAKGRPSDKPVAWLVGSVRALDEFGADVDACAHALAEAFWPGGLTLVVKAAPSVPEAFCSKAGTIGLRMPDSKAALALIEAADSPLATTSANFAGRPAPMTREGLDPDFLAASGAVVFAPAAGGCGGGGAPAPAPGDRNALASTVVDCSGASPILLRAGTISIPEIEAVCGRSLRRPGDGHSA